MTAALTPRPIRKVRFIEPGNLPYRRSLRNLVTYDKYIRNPSLGLTLLATIVRDEVPDTLVYSESVAKIQWKDVLDADVVFIGIFTFAAPRGYELARYVKEHSDAVVVLGGLHASLAVDEAVQHADFVLTGEADESIVELLRALNEGLPLTFPGLAHAGPHGLVTTGPRPAPDEIDISPDHNLVYRFRQMAWHNSLWPQVLASRGCPFRCDYCAVVRHWGTKVRGRSPDEVVEDIRATIAFFEQGPIPRLARALWIVDDNFFARRAWAISVLQAIIDSDISYAFTIQARYEVGLDDEMLDLLKRAGFMEIAIGIEFIEDEAFETYHKDCTRHDVIKAIRNVQAHGLNVRGLFILGADNHTRGVGQRLARFVIDNGLRGMLVQSMYFIPGTPVFETHEDRLIHKDWSKYTGHVVHYPTQLSPSELADELVHASRAVYSVPRLLRALVSDRGMNRLLFIGEFFWQRAVAADRAKEGRRLRGLPPRPAPVVERTGPSPEVRRCR